MEKQKKSKETEVEIQPAPNNSIVVPIMLNLVASDTIIFNDGKQFQASNIKVTNNDRYVDIPEHSTLTFRCNIPGNEKISEVLGMLKLSNSNFEILESNVEHGEITVKIKTTKPTSFFNQQTVGMAMIIKG